MVVGIAGLPACGKSRLIEEYRAKGFAVFDDINANAKGGWIKNIALAKSFIAGGRDVAISDIMFCEDGWRERLQADLGAPVQWICFDNSPEVCRKNSELRAAKNPNQILELELGMIDRLSPKYRPTGKVIAVPDASTSA